MNIVDFSHSSISLLPPLVALGLAILTRRVLISLGVGVLLGSLLLTDFSFGATAEYVGSTAKGLFIDDGAINSWNMSIVAFLVLLGMTTALLTLSGGTRAFAEWAQTKIKSKRGAKLLAASLGVFIFVDDYFNSLAVGSISRPVTDRFYVSRAKLAYILDSTAAPDVCADAGFKLGSLHYHAYWRYFGIAWRHGIFRIKCIYSACPNELLRCLCFINGVCCCVVPVRYWCNEEA